MTEAGTAQVRREVAASAGRVWQVVTDWPRHGRHVTGTTVEVVGPAGVGQRFVAVSRAGRLRVEDPMEVTVWEPPLADAGRVRLEKRGDVLAGWAEIIVSPLGAHRCELIWREQIIAGTQPPLPLRAVTRPLSGLLTRLMIGRLARRLGREAEAAEDDHA